MLNSTLIPIMRKRGKRSAIINFSSCTGKFISPILSTYPASKRMINVYSDYLRK
jgi:short-subunit dehydrogenase